MPEDSGLFAFSENDLARIRSETPIEYLEFHKELASTNDLSLELAALDDVPLPLLVLTEKQTAGRGQRERHWWSSPGALTFSFSFSTEQFELPPEQWPKVSLTAGLAICEALEELLPGDVVQVKWPNDVYAQGKKICGILVESPSVSQRRLVIGVGINVNNSVQDAPAEVAELATTMADLQGNPTPLAAVLIKVVRNLSDRLPWIGTRDEELAARWRQTSLLIGLKVAVENPAGSCQGICRGIDGDGALLVETGEGEQRCLAGTVSILPD